MFRTILYVSILTAIFSIILTELLNRSKHPLAGLNIEEIIQAYDYPVEVHHVTTQDGYILTLHRIPHGKENSSRNRVPVLLLHGHLQSAWDYVHYGPHKSLSFLLSEQGYDVWLGNVRGTAWSRNHTILNPDEDSSFWNFTVNEIGTYDVPAFIDHILEGTNHSSLHYIGFSQGTTVFLIFGSEKSDYLSKVKLFTALSPAAFFKNPKSPLLRFIANNLDIMQTITRFFNYYELFKRGDLLSSYIGYICNENSIFVDLCVHHIFNICGDDSDEMSKNMLSLTSSHFPSGVSLTQMVHIFQMIRSGNFSKYDFGIQENIEKYGQESPPRYNLSKITTPTAAYYSSNDWAVDITNVEKLVKVLPNVVKTYKVPSEKFSHYDFLAAENVVPLLYKAVIDEILKY